MTRRTAATVVALVLAACGGTISSAPDAGDSGRASGSSSGIGSSSASGSGGGTSSGVSSSGSSGIDCSGSGSGGGVSCCWQHDGASVAQHQQCVWQCCNTVDPDYGKIYKQAVQQCACNGGPCTSECANEFCANGTFASYGDGCGDCIQKVLVAPCVSVAQCCPQSSYYAECVNGCP